MLVYKTRGDKSPIDSYSLKENKIFIGKKTELDLLGKVPNVTFEILLSKYYFPNVTFKISVLLGHYPESETSAFRDKRQLNKAFSWAFIRRL